MGLVSFYNVVTINFALGKCTSYITMWSNIRLAVNPWNDPILVVTDLFEIYRYFLIQNITASNSYY